MMYPKILLNEMMDGEDSVFRVYSIFLLSAFFQSYQLFSQKITLVFLQYPHSIRIISL